MSDSDVDGGSLAAGLIFGVFYRGFLDLRSDDDVGR